MADENDIQRINAAFARGRAIGLRHHAPPNQPPIAVDARAKAWLSAPMLGTASLSAMLRVIAFLAMLLPFAGLSLMAKGVMPDMAPDGTMALVLCGQSGPTTALLDLTTGVVTQKPAPPADHRCDWAMGHADLAQNAPLSLPQRSAEAGRVSPTTAHILWRPGFDPRGIHARAPPVIL